MRTATGIEYVAGRERAELLLHPLRLKVLEAAREPVSASDIARSLGLPRQKVNYHVRELAEGGFLVLSDERRKRNLIEKRYVASARSYVLSPDILGPLAAGGAHGGDRLSAARVLALTVLAQSELGRVMREAEGEGKRVSTLSLDAAFRFESAEQRLSFAEALEAAVVEVVARHTSPWVGAEGGEGEGRPYRLVLGCYPIPSEAEAAAEADEGVAG